MIKILNSSLQRQFIIKKVTSASRFEELNGENTLNFSTVLDSKIAQYFTDNSILELDNDYFDVAYSKKEYNNEGFETLDVEGEHVSYRLNNPQFDKETFVETGTPSYILGRILSGTGLTVGSVSFGNTMTYSVLEKTSRRQLLMGFVNMLKGELQFNKFSVSILSKRGSRDVQLYTTGKNVNIVSKIVNKRELDVNNNHLVSYVCESILLKNKSVNIGDDILLVQKGLGIRESLRIVSYSYNPYEKYSAELEITNFVHGIEDEMYRIESSAVAKGNMYNGVRIGPNDGFVAEGRIEGDSKIYSKTIMNATEGISIYSDTGRGLERNFFVDLDGRIKGRSLDITGDATFQGAISASTINIGNGNFTVDIHGNMKAYNAYFEGDISGSDITGSNIDVDSDVNIGDWLSIGGGTGLYNYKGISIEHGANEAKLSVSDSGLFEIESWRDMELFTHDTLRLYGWDVILEGSTNYIDSVRDYNEIATMYEIEEIWDYLLG